MCPVKDVDQVAVVGRVTAIAERTPVAGRRAATLEGGAAS